MAKIRNAFFEAMSAAASYIDTAGAYMDYNSTGDGNAAGGYAQFGGKGPGGASIGTKIRTIFNGVVKDAISVAASGLLITLLAGSTLAAQAVTATTLLVSGTTSYTAGGVTSYIGQTATPGAIINGSQAGDLLIRAGSKRIVFSPDDGATSAMVIAANSVVTVASTLSVGGATTIGNGLTVSANGINVVAGTSSFQASSVTSIGFGAAAVPGVLLDFRDVTLNASSGGAIAQWVRLTMVAQANNDNLTTLSVAPTYAKNGKTGLTAFGIRSVSPSATGTGTIDTAYGLYVDAPTVATKNIGAYIAGTVVLPSYGAGGGEVTVGGADSGGVGYRILKVPN